MATKQMAGEALQLNNGCVIPPLGFGTWQLEHGATAKVVDYALQAGYRLIDTARIYRNERQVGKGIAASGIPREDIFVTTKLWNWNQGYDTAFKAFDKSLKKLGLKYLDLYLLHWPVTGKRLQSWQALEELYKSGRVRSIGVSNFTVRHLEELLGVSDVVPVVNQVEFHPFLYEEQKPLLEFCRQHNIVVEAYSPLAHAERLQDDTITKVAKEYHKSNAQVLLGWAIQHGTVPIPKSSNQARIIENFAVFDFQLTGADMETINNLSDGTRTCGDPNRME